MPDPVNRAEVEDVLSSIRRLVSSDVRPKEVAAGTGPDTAPGRLVLTPALRVQDDDETKWAEAHPEPDEAEAIADAADAQDASGLTEDAHDETAGQAAPAQADEAPQADSQNSNRNAGYSAQAGGSASSSYFFLNHLRKEARQTAPDQECAKDNRPTEDDAPEDEGAQAAENTVEQRVEDHDTQWDQPEAVSEDQYADSDETPDPEQDETAESLFDKTEDVAPDAPLVFRRASTKELTEKIAALEEVIAKTPDQWEPDDTGKDDYSGTEVEAMEWEDHEDQTPPEAAAADTTTVLHDIDADQSGNIEPAFEAQDPQAERDEDVFVAQPQFRHRGDPIDFEQVDEGDAVLDEESLRELVSDIVRQELQGRLGERITRNVRKLVRREIQRALAELDLD